MPHENVSVMTSADRNTWGDFRANLESHSDVNAATLAAIDASLFAVCLDSIGSDDSVHAVRRGLHFNRDG